MKNGDFYNHYKGGEYFFDCIALPLVNHAYEIKPHFIQKVRYHEDTQDMNLYVANGVTYIESDIPYVIYQSEKDYDTDKVWAREVDDFFGYKQLSDNNYVKRFTL